MKKIMLGLFVLIGAVSLIACNTNTGGLEEFNKPENVYAISVVTGVDAVIANSGSSVANLDIEVETEEEQVLIDQAHIDTMLGILNNDGFKVEVLESDNEDFENLIKVTINKERTFKFYFNEVLIKEEKETETEDGETETELEQEFSIDGIIIENDVTFTVKGTKEVEIEEDKDEREEEFELELIISLDEDNYTKVKYETEVETSNKDGNEIEKSYKYQIYKDGKKVKTMKMEFEEENNEIELELKVEDLINNIVSKYELEIEGKANKALVKYSIKEEGKDEVKGTIEFKIVSKNGVITYEEVKEENNDPVENEEPKEEDKKELSI